VIVYGAFGAVNVVVGMNVAQATRFLSKTLTILQKVIGFTLSAFKLTVNKFILLKRKASINCYNRIAFSIFQEPFVAHTLGAEFFTVLWTKELFTIGAAIHFFYAYIISK